MAFQRALELHHQGRLTEAAQVYQQILRADPGHLDALIHLGALTLAQGQPEPAEALLRRAVALAPGSAPAAGNLAAVLQARGRHADAIPWYTRALELEPDMLDARFGLAACLQAGGQGEAAMACYQTILAAAPAHAEALYGLATMLAALGRVDEAVARYRATLAADPDFAEASLGLGKLLARGDAPGEAIACFHQALDVDPDYAEARIALATLLARFDRDTEAEQEFRHVLAADPGHADARNGLGILLDRRQQSGDALAEYRAVLARDPDQIDALAGMANALKNIGQHAEALALARRVVALRPQFAPAAGLLGAILAEMGLIEEAKAELRRSVALAPARPEALYHLALVAKVRADDGTLEALEAALPHTPALPPREQCLIHFALAKAYEDVGRPDDGFTHLLRGNALKRAQFGYPEHGTLAAIRRIQAVFTADFMAARRERGDPSATPVFVVGMPRSGTTLVEQTLASHHAVFGAGERAELSQAVRRLGAAPGGGGAYPEAARSLDGAALRALGADYAASLTALAPDALRIVDKMPGNFLYAGLIHLILPNARIIHMRRDPIDTCLSCFSKLFVGEQAFSYDLAELGRYYRAYEALMAHWRAVLPACVMLEVEYEAMVEDFATQARRIVAHCGLDWDPACLDFHKTARPVRTASMVQVRQPIYRGSVGRWRPRDDLLRPLLDALAGR